MRTTLIALLLASTGAHAAPESPSPIVRAQVLLDRANFSAGEIDGTAGGNTRQALLGFQRSRGLPQTGKADDATLAALDDGQPVLVTYTVTDGDAAGPFAPVPEEMADKAKLPALAYSSAAEALGERFHVSPAFLRKLNPGTDIEQAGAQIMVPNVGAAPALPKAASIVVDGSDHTLSLLDAGGKVIAQMPVTSGSEHDPLPVGHWKINGVARNPPFHYNPKLFWDAKPGDSKATIQPGPNNPVGVVWIDLSKDHYGIHGTPEPGKIGKTQSHGCIRLANWDAARVADAVGPGTPVVLQQ
ncbi:L,D-transpeptidase family protein [Pseudoduganella sp. S-14]|uniref:L,D-transpeptidase family protein n=1 Tax=Pseudoduganella sp. S-14 TaxID=3404065 RepID=UPI003CEB0F83